MKRRTWTLLPLTLLLSLALPTLAEAGGAEGKDGKADGHHGPDPINWFNLDYKELQADGTELTPGSKAHHMAPPLGLALMNFGAFFFVLVWKAGPPISSFLRGRHTTIKEALEEGKRLREEASAKLEEYSAKIKGVEAEVDALIAEVRESAEGEKSRIIAEAQRTADLMKKQAEAQIAAEVSRARDQLEREVMQAALAAAETIIREKASAADHQKLIDGFLVDLSTAGTPNTETPS